LFAAFSYFCASTCTLVIQTSNQPGYQASGPGLFLWFIPRSGERVGCGQDSHLQACVRQA
jgi:hypothetical protein